MEDTTSNLKAVLRQLESKLGIDTPFGKGEAVKKGRGGSTGRRSSSTATGAGGLADLSGAAEGASWPSRGF